MALRSNWEGFLRFNLISVPVRAYSASTTGRGKIAFHQIHKGCGSRIKYKKVCPIHGEVSKDEIVSGYEIAKGEYVIVDPEELDKLRTENDKAISIDTFIRPESIDPIYFSERSYYLAPNGKVGQKPFAVLQKVMQDEKRFAVAQVVFAGREQLVLLRPVDKLLTMTMLSYADQIKPSAAFDDEVPDVDVSEKEMALAHTLIEASTADDFDIAHYKDTHTSKLKELIEAKSAGRKITAPRGEEAPHVINLMDALKRSLDAVKKGPPHEKPGRDRHPHRKRAATTRRKTG